MPSAASLAATFVAGLASFVAPCTLPLLPAYLSYVSGVAVADLADPARAARVRPRLVAGACLYVAGFSTVLVLGGLGVAGLGHTQVVMEHARAVEIAGGVLLVGLGLLLAGAIRGGPLLRERRLRVPERLRGAGPWAAYPIGLIVGVGWTPCVGPYLGAALSLAAVGGHAGEGALLLGVYSVGLGLPFIGAALAGASLPDLGRRAQRWAPLVARIGGASIAALGVLLLSGAYSHLSSFLAEISTPR